MRLAATLLLLLAACSDWRATRITAGQSDTVIVNNRLPVALPVQLLDDAGRALHPRGLHYQWVSGDHIPISGDGRVTCTRRGDATVRVSHGALSSQIVVRCRPMRGFRYLPRIHLVVGGTAQEVAVGAVGVDGRPVTLLAGNMSIRDSTIASVHDDSITPKARGMTLVDVEAGDCAMSIPVDVVERMATPDALQPYQEFVAAPLHLAASETRRWHIPAGLYDIALDSAASDRHALILGALGTRCWPYRGEGQHYSCTAGDSAVVVVRNSGHAGRDEALPGALIIQRRPEPATAPAPNQNGALAKRDDADRRRPRADACAVYMR